MQTATFISNCGCRRAAFYQPHSRVTSRRPPRSMFGCVRSRRMCHATIYGEIKTPNRARSHDPGSSGSGRISELTMISRGAEFKVAPPHQMLSPPWRARNTKPARDNTGTDPCTSHQVARSQEILVLLAATLDVFASPMAAKAKQRPTTALNQFLFIQPLRGSHLLFATRPLCSPAT